MAHPLDTIDAAVRAVLLKHGRLASPANALAGDADLYQAALSSRPSVNVMLTLETEVAIEYPDRMLERSVSATIASIRDAVASIGQT